MRAGAICHSLRAAARAASTAATALWLVLPSPAAAAPARPAPHPAGAKGERATPPAAQPEKKIAFPEFTLKSLPNGLRVVLVEKHSEPAVSLRLVVPAGRVYVTDAKAGLAGATASLLTKGTEKRSSQEIAETIDAVGGRLTTGADSDFGYASARVTSDQLDLGLELLADTVLHPTFPEAEIERWRKETLNGLKVQLADTGYLANLALQRTLYGSFPYGLPPGGTPETVRALTRQDLIDFHHAHYVPAGSILAVSGDIQPEAALAKVESALGGWTGKAAAPPAFSVPERSQRQIVVVDKPDAVQTQVHIGQIGLVYGEPDFFVEQVYASVLGGGASARLFQEVRTKRSLSYGAYSGTSDLLRPGVIHAETSTKTASTVEALQVTLEVIDGLAQAPVPAAELKAREANLIGEFPRRIETPDGIGTFVLEVLSHGQGREFIDSYRDRLGAVTSADVQRFARQRVHTDRAVIVLVGNASAFAADLGKKFGKFETIPSAELDPLRPDLRKAKAELPKASQADIAKAWIWLRLAQEAMGGPAFLNQRSQILHGTGKLNPPGAPQPIPIQSAVSYQVLPDRQRLELTLPMGLMVQGFDGKTGWVSMGPQTQDQTATMAEGQHFGLDQLRRLDEHGVAVRPISEETQDGRKVQVVDVSDPSGHTTRFTLDAETHLVTATSYEAQGTSNEVRYSGYKPEAGVQVARKVSVRQNGQSLVDLEYTQVEINPTIAENLFSKPAG